MIVTSSPGLLHLDGLVILRGGGAERERDRAWGERTRGEESKGDESATRRDHAPGRGAAATGARTKDLASQTSPLKTAP